MGDYVEFFRRLIHNARHPKVEATVQRCLDNLRRGWKTLVFCERRETQATIGEELAQRLGETTADIGAMQRRRNQFLERRGMTDFSYLYCVIDPLTQDPLQFGSERMHALVRLVVEKARFLGQFPHGPAFLRLLDLCALHLVCRDQTLGEVAGMILEHVEALRRYVTPSDTYEAQRNCPPIETHSDSPMTVALASSEAVKAMVEKGLAEMASGNSVWQRLGSSDNPLALISQLVDSETRNIEIREEVAKATVVAEILHRIAQCLRRIVFHFRLFSLDKWEGEEDSAETVARRIVLENEFGGSLAKRVYGFLSQILTADGSIRRDSDKSLRQSLWQGVTLLRDPLTVRQLNGSTDPSTRNNLCSAFNTPLAPHILICTAIGSEGIDLHRQCAEVIHHDLPWNPAKLEQRTGRVDRVGSLAVMKKRQIRIGIPFLARNYDEFAYNTVLTRAQKMEVLFGRPEFADQGLEEEITNESDREAIIDPSPEYQIKTEGEVYSLPDKLVNFFGVDFRANAE